MENIFLTITENGGVKVKYLDFGLSKVILNGESSEDRFGSLAYCSPEIVVGDRHTEATDVWSMGVLLHIMLSGMVPFITGEDRTTAYNIVKGRINFSCESFEYVTAEGKDLIRRMLDVKQSTRLTID